MKNIDSYYEKAVLTNGIIEITRYEKLNTKGGGKREGEGLQRDENYRQTQRKRRNTIRQLICTNFDNQSKFVTLTFNDQQDFDIKDVKQCNEAFHRFCKRLRRRYKDIEYVAVIEFQDKNDRGAVHYHMICNLPYIKSSELSALWGCGFVKINRIEKVDNIGAYVVKYMNKDIDDERLQGLKAYNCSRGLRRPVELKSWTSSDENALRDLNNAIEKLTPSYSAKYESDKAGTIEYIQYNLHRQNNTGDNTGQGAT